ncbi:hypothetical protein [Rickettsia endosymbiont of Gonocerus acuteangulatus]|uniref:hypothetical protein n=1 Tax=Rickettsia endosymbiont of Gonocerus acuteangulatus TaxID=3066266 RepID=UPI003132D7FC
MLKSLIFELLKGSMEQEKKSYGKPFVYFFNVLGLALIIAANYLYVADAVKFCSLMNIGIASIIISIIIEAIRCYLKYKNRYRTINMLRDKSRSLVDSVSDQFSDLIPNKTLIKYLPTIIRYVPTTILTFLIGVYIKRKFAKNITNPLLGRW